MLARLVSLRYLIVGVALAIASVGLVGVAKLGFDSDARVYFERDSQERRALDDLERRHGRLHSVVLLVVPGDDDAYAERPIAALAELISGLSEIPEVISYDAISEVGALGGVNAEGGELDVALLRSDVASQPVRTAPLVAEDGTAAAAIATLVMTGDSSRDLHKVVADIAAVRDRVRQAYPDLDIMLTGSAALNATFIEALRYDLVRLVPAQIVLLILLLIVSVGSLSATIVLLAVLGVATVSTMGLAGWLGMTVNGVTSAVPTVLMGLAVATCVHIILAWQDALRQSTDRIGAVGYALSVNAKPVFLAVATTIASFLCLNFSTSPPFQQFGNLVAFGLAVTYVVSFTLLPALLLIVPASRALSRRPVEQAMAGLSRLVLSLRTAVVLAFVAITGLAVYGVSQIRFEDTFAHYFDDRFEFRRATDLYEEKISGITVIEFSLPASEGGNAASPENLRRLREFVAWVEEQPKVVGVASFLQVLDAFRTHLSDRLDDDGLPVSDEIAQAVVDVYFDADSPEMPPYLFDASREHAYVSALFSQISSAEVIAFATAANAQLGALWPGTTAHATGLSVLSSLLSSRNTEAMFVGTLVALVTISAVLVFALGGLKLGAVSLVPNLLPLVLAYGFWGLVFQEVSFAATVVVAMTFGIVVDDTVHIMSRYQRLRRHGRLDPQQAIIESFCSVGVAVLTTSFAIAAGFAVLILSGFLVNRHLGLLTVITLAAALLTDLLLLPNLLVASDSNKTDRPAAER